MNYDYYYHSPSTVTYSSAGELSGGVLALLILVYALIFVAAYVVTAIFLGKIFRKAGVESWVAWVPFYNVWKLLELGGQQGFWSILLVIPVVNFVALVFLYIAMYHVGKKLGKEDTFVLFAIQLPLVWMIWLSVDSSTWNEKKGAGRLDKPAQPATSAT